MPEQPPEPTPSVQTEEPSNPFRALDPAKLIDPDSIPAKPVAFQPEPDPDAENGEAEELETRPSEDPAGKAQVIGRTAGGVNWAGVFLLYSKGASLKELSDEFGIPYNRLVTKARAEDWDTLVKHHGSAEVVAPPPLPSVVKQSADEVNKAKARIDANREAAFSVATRLRNNVVSVLHTYEKESAFLRPEDILTLAKASKLIDDSAMIALGDVPQTAAQAAKSGTAGAGNNTLPQIVINIPQFVSPQALREAEKQVEAIPAPVEVKQLQELEVVGGKPSKAVKPSFQNKFTVDFAKLGAAVVETGEEG